MPAIIIVKIRSTTRVLIFVMYIYKYKRTLYHSFPFRTLMKDYNLRTKPKFIVFLSQLLLLFKFCVFCKADNQSIQAKKWGTMIIVRTICMSTLLEGGSISKVTQMFKHMNLGTISLSTFFKHPRVFLFFYFLFLLFFIRIIVLHF